MYAANIKNKQIRLCIDYYSLFAMIITKIFVLNIRLKTYHFDKR